MRIDVSAFRFDAASLALNKNQDFIAEIPPGLTSDQMLFDSYREHLQLPDYFGKNWDALDECLRDLYWIEQRRVVILHKDLPPLDRKTLLMYLDVLSFCVLDWEPGEAHELVVVFPKASRDVICDLANSHEKGE